MRYQIYPVEREFIQICPRIWIGFGLLEMRKNFCPLILK